jgi:pimeloyl-ACP methyl ester carboxylesterase
MTGTAQIFDRSVRIWDASVTLRVRIAGTGPALLYLHPADGLAWNPFVVSLTESFTVFAPEFPGTSQGDPAAVERIDDMWDLVLAYEQGLREIGLRRPLVIGHSFGGMLAAELAATFPGIFERMALIDPIGLWRDDAPVGDWLTASGSELPGMLFADPDSPTARSLLAAPPDPDTAVRAEAARIWATGCTGKFLWPVPDRGLIKRLHRISTPTLIVWGERDTLAPVIYAGEFCRRIADSRVAIIPGAAHLPHLEQPEATLAHLTRFLLPAGG